TILLAGYQARGTRGDRLAHGEKEIKIHGQMLPVRAEIVKLDNMSAHADYDEILQWLGHFTSAPRKTFVTHREPHAGMAVRNRIEEKLGWTAEVPKHMQTVDL